MALRVRPALQCTYTVPGEPIESFSSLMPGIREDFGRKRFINCTPLCSLFWHGDSNISVVASCRNSTPCSFHFCWKFKGRNSVLVSIWYLTIGFKNRAAARQGSLKISGALFRNCYFALCLGRDFGKRKTFRTCGDVIIARDPINIALFLMIAPMATEPFFTFKLQTSGSRSRTMNQPPKNLSKSLGRFGVQFN